MQKIDLEKVDRTQFDVKDNGNGLILINPRHDKHRWEPDELWFRSVLCDKEGNVLSYGFPKFKNFHEDVDRHLDMIDKSWKIVVTDKLDGTLIIVSQPVAGVTYLRTRGNHDLGEFNDPVMTLIQNRYPGLLTDYPGMSVLLEYVAPTNQIVVQYTEPDLVLLGLVDHATRSLLSTQEHLEYFAERSGLRVPKFHAVTVTRDTLPAYMKVVSSWSSQDNCEGVVISCHTHEECVPFKVKSQWYLMMHALRFQMTKRRLAQLLVIEHARIKNFADLQAYLYSLGYDYEISQVVKTQAEEFFTLLRHAQGVARDVYEWVFTKGNNLLSRKNFVQEFQKMEYMPKWAFHYALSLLDNKPDTHLIPLAVATGEGVRVIQNWLDNQETLKKELIKTPEDFEQEEI